MGFFFVDFSMNFLEPDEIVFNVRTLHGKVKSTYLQNLNVSRKAQQS